MKRTAKIAVFISVLLANASASAGLFGLSLSDPKKSTAGDIVESELPNPFSDFIVLDETIFEDEQLQDIPGRLVAVVENAKGETLLIPYAEFIQKDEAKGPEIKSSEFNYDAYLLDTKSAASLGVPVAAAQMEGNYKVEYRFYKGATCRMSLRDIDKKKFNELARRIRVDIASQKDLKLKSLRVIAAAATLNSAFSVMQGVKADAKVSGPGWQVGGMFYSSQQMAKNRTRVGVALVPYAEDMPISTKPSTGDRIDSAVLTLPGNQAVPVAKEALGPSGVRFQNIMRIE